MACSTIGGNWRAGWLDIEQAWWRRRHRADAPVGCRPSSSRTTRHFLGAAAGYLGGAVRLPQANSGLPGAHAGHRFMGFAALPL